MKLKMCNRIPKSTRITRGLHPRGVSKRIPKSTRITRGWRIHRVKKERKPKKTVEEKVFYAYSQGSKRRGLEFSLTLESFWCLRRSSCHYCGTVNANGIDRKDNSVGYTENNALPCCYPCNRLKLNLSYQDFIEAVNRIYQNRVAGKQNGST